METMAKLGTPHKGSRWDEIGMTEIAQILISHGKSAIYSIQFVYVADGKLFPSKIHGSPDGLKFDTVTFDYPSEYLVSISGDHSLEGLASITFGTNKRKYGPFGRNTEDDCKSEFDAFGTKKRMFDQFGMSGSHYEKFAYNFRPKSSFGGFHGSLQTHKSGVGSIGVYVRPLESLADIEKDIGTQNE
ncbi:hypothetical protein LXL04_005400 [Taraxacum kok-saghyz]